MLKLRMKLGDELIDLESCFRYENMGIYVVPEGVDKESPTMVTFLVNLLSECLRLTEDGPDLQIQRAHRSAGLQPPEDVPHHRHSVIESSQDPKQRVITPHGMAGKGIHLERLPHKPVPLLYSSYPQKINRICRGP